MNKLTRTCTLFTYLLSFYALQSNAQIINTYAGNGSAGYSGDGGQATNAEMNYVTGITEDLSGNIYVADQYNHRIRKISTSGIITTFAGNGSGSFSGDGGPATAAALSNPCGVAVDISGDVYIADQTNQRIRMVNPSGTISTIAGNGTLAHSGDGGPATAAGLFQPVNMAVDKLGNVYIAEYSGNYIRMVNASGIITSIAGNGTGGFSGDGGPATAAELYYPMDVAVDTSGNIYIDDQYNQRIRMINSSGIITTIAGNGNVGFSGDGGPATATELNYPTGIGIDLLGNVYIADQYNQRVRMVNPLGIITTVIGSGSAGFAGDGGPASAAKLRYPWDVVIDPSGLIYETENGNYRVRASTGSMGINEENALENTIRFYPNPFSQSIHVDISIDKPVSIAVFNMLGEKLDIRTMKKGSNTVDTKAYPPGLYILQVKTEGYIFSKKIMKVN